MLTLLTFYASKRNIAKENPILPKMVLRPTGYVNSNWPDGLI